MTVCTTGTAAREFARVAAPRITSFLVKVASRCNLDCDYCYVYHHADQSWRSMPKLLSSEHRDAFVMRLAEYVRDTGLSRCSVVFHGGEPLLAGAELLADFSAAIRANVEARVDIGLQTNGLLLSEFALDIFEHADIAVSLSMDGPRAAHDKHRTTRKGRSSFDRVMVALQRLKKRPSIFAGVIAVIDISTSPGELFRFFNEHQPPKLDFLLPDAHNLFSPPGRDATPDSYERWLISAFDLWLDQYPHLSLRTFEALLDSMSGLASNTDAFGLGDVSLISIETDGSYHDLDVLKVTQDGATKLDGTVEDTPIAAVAASASIAAHRRRLQKEGLCRQCQECPVMQVCGGGSLPHRFGPNGFDHPTVYCREMLALITHVRARLDGLLTKSNCACAPRAPGVDIAAFEVAERATGLMQELCKNAQCEAHQAFIDTLQSLDPADEMIRASVEAILALPSELIAKMATHPGAIVWQRTMTAQAAGRSAHTVDGAPVRADASYLRHLLRQLTSDPTLRIAEDDPWLRVPFGDAIYFEAEEVAARGRMLVEQALQIVDRWRPALGVEMRTASRAVQFVRDPLAIPKKIVSFSDNSVPGALYVSIVQDDRLIDPYDLADSLIHEHRHQKLYLLERLNPTVEPNVLLVPSPWRDDARPPSGLLHAVFVFVELGRFWTFVHNRGPARLHNRAVHQIRDTDTRLAQAFSTLDNCPLTKTGSELVEVLRAAAASTYLAA